LSNTCRAFVALCACGVAAAEGLPRPPHLLSLESGGSAALDLGFGFFEEPFGQSIGSTVEHTLELSLPVSPGVVLDVVLPAGTWFPSDDAGADTTTVLGSVGLGVRGLTSGESGTLRWHAGGGFNVWLPTATDGGSDGDPEQVTALALLLVSNHSVDSNRFQPFALTMAPAGTVGIEAGPLLGQVQFGFDILVPADAPDGAETIGVLRSGFAMGAGGESAAGFVELDHGQCLTCDGGDDDLSAIAFSARTRGTPFIGELVINVPTDSFVDEFVKLGVEARLGGRW